MADEERAARIKNLVDAGLGSSDARIVNDLSEHALMEMLEVMKRVTNTAPPNLRIHTYNTITGMAATNFGLASFVLGVVGKLEND